MMNYSVQGFVLVDHLLVVMIEGLGKNPSGWEQAFIDKKWIESVSFCLCQKNVLNYQYCFSPWSFRVGQMASAAQSNSKS